METQPMRMMRVYSFFFPLLLLALVACNSQEHEKKTTAKPKKPSPATKVDKAAKTVVPAFNADSAYTFIEQQVAFGPRVSNSEGHKACGDYLVAKLREFGADTVIEQKTDLVAYNGDVLHARNIIAAFQPGKKERILLCAHWDTRPWADSDPNPANHYKPYPGANDGGSGVGVLLEVARQLASVPTNCGVDIIFFDAEDYGCHEAETTMVENGGWALGSGYWARNPHEKYYTARYGILLDIVGAPASKFCIEEYSGIYALNIVKKVWETAHGAGYSEYFPNEIGGKVTDDHVDVNKVLGIPCIDIINCDRESPNGFGPYHHTMKDDMDWIDKRTLNAVGQTVLNVIYNEK